MTVFAALLRAVNVGGRNRVPMAALRELCASLGLEQATTLLQSGNVVFRAAGSGTVVARRLEEGLRAKLSVECGVMVRTAAELRGIVEANPLGDAARGDPSHLVVVFLSGSAGTDAEGALSRAHSGPEDIRFADRELYVHYRDGIGHSKLTAAVLERHLGVTCTARNWNTVTKLLALAEALA